MESTGPVPVSSEMRMNASEESIYKGIHSSHEKYTYERFLLKYGHNTKWYRDSLVKDKVDYVQEIVIQSDERYGINYNDFKSMPSDARSDFFSRLYNAVKSPLLSENLPWSITMYPNNQNKPRSELLKLGLTSDTFRDEVLLKTHSIARDAINKRISLATSSHFLKQVTFFDIFGAFSFFLAQWFQTTGLIIFSCDYFLVRLLFGIPFYIIMICLSFVVGAICVIISFIIGPLLDLMTGCRYWTRVMEKDLAAVEEMMQKAPLSDNELIDSSIRLDLEKLAEQLNSKYSLLTASVKIRPKFLPGSYISTGSGKNRRTVYIPAHVTKEYSLQFHRRGMLGPSNAV